MRADPLTFLYRLALLSTVVITGYMATTPMTFPVTLMVSDKFLHALVFWLLLMLVDYSWPESGLGPAKVFMVFAYGVLIELVQYFLPYRDFSLADLLADALGMGCYPISVPLLRKLPLLCMRWKL